LQENRREGKAIKGVALGEKIFNNQTGIKNMKGRDDH
jgi:hypothetical protein